MSPQQFESESVVISVRDILQQIKALKEQLKVYKPKLQSEIFWSLAKKKVVNQDLARLQGIMKALNEELDIPPWERHGFGKDEIR